MGASLLDAVLAETLDPAYAAGRRPGARRRPPPSRPRRRGRRAGGADHAIAGLLLAVDLRPGGRRAPEAANRSAPRSSTTSTGSPPSATSCRPARGPQQAEVSTRDELLAATAMGSGRSTSWPRPSRGRAVPVTGPRPAGHPGQRRPEGRRRPRRRHHRGRRAAGCATATSSWWSTPSGRPVPRRSASTASGWDPTTAIRFAGEAVLVDFRPVTNPYEISAIGDPGHAVGRASSPAPRTAPLAVISETYGLRFDYAQEDELDPARRQRPPSPSRRRRRRPRGRSGHPTPPPGG